MLDEKLEMKKMQQPTKVLVLSKKYTMLSHEEHYWLFFLIIENIYCLTLLFFKSSENIEYGIQKLYFNFAKIQKYFLLFLVWSKWLITTFFCQNNCYCCVKGMKSFGVKRGLRSDGSELQVLILYMRLSILV